MTGVTATDATTPPAVGRRTGSGYDVAAVRERFPALAAGAVHLDSPGGTQVPRAVADAAREAMLAPTAVRGSLYPAARASEENVVECRAAIGDLLGADPAGVVFGRSATQLTFDLARTLADGWGPGDEVVVSRLDHDANISPWLVAARRAGATVRWCDFDPGSGELTTDHLADVLTERTRLVAVTGASNLIGTRPDLPALSAMAHAVGALVWVDGVHLTAHAGIDVAALGADFYACSAYKFLGPHCGFLAAAPALLEGLRPDKLAPSSDAVPERFELGTLPYEAMAATTAAVETIADLAPGAATGRRERVLASMAAVEAHEDALRERIEEGLVGMPVVVRSRAAHRTPTLLMTFPAPGDDAEGRAARHLAERGINAPAGNFYALRASQHLGLGDAGGLRVGLAPYTDAADVDRLLEGLASFVASA